MRKGNTLTCFFIGLIIFSPILTTKIIFANFQQTNISEISITPGPDFSASVAVITDGNEFFSGLYINSNWDYDQLPLPSEIMPNTSFTNPFSAFDDQNNLVVFLKQFGSSEAYIVHYFNSSIVKYSILNIENKNERLFFTDGNFYLAYHNDSSFQIDRIFINNFTLINVFDSNQVIGFTTGESFLTDISIYYNEVVLGIEYLDFFGVGNNTSAYFHLIFQDNDLIVEDFDLFPPHIVESVAVFEHTVLIWGDQGFFFVGIPLNMKEKDEDKYQLAITKENLDLILFSDREFILTNDGVVQLWEIDDTFDFFNFVLGVENPLPFEVVSNLIVDNNGELYFAFGYEINDLTIVRLPPEEFFNQVGTTIPLTTPLPTYDIFIILAFLSISFLTLIIFFKATRKSKKSKHPIPYIDQEHFYNQNQLQSQIITKNLCSNCRAKHESTDVFCAECGWKLFTN
ncbi:MAG: hypothetical protein ACW98D_17375 [Promethearchaeota archaeon]